MRNAMPMRWIEQREARQVLANSRFERAPTPPWCGARDTEARDAASEWLPRLGAWLAARHPMGWLATQAQPALIPVTLRRDNHPLDSDDYRCCW